MLAKQQRVVGTARRAAELRVRVVQLIRSHPSECKAAGKRVTAEGRNLYAAALRLEARMHRELIAAASFLVPWLGRELGPDSSPQQGPLTPSEIDLLHDLQAEEARYGGTRSVRALTTRSKTTRPHSIVELGMALRRRTQHAPVSRDGLAIDAPAAWELLVLFAAGYAVEINAGDLGLEDLGPNDVDLELGPSGRWVIGRRRIRSHIEDSQLPGGTADMYGNLLEWLELAVHVLDAPVSDRHDQDVDSESTLPITRAASQVDRSTVGIRSATKGEHTMPTEIQWRAILADLRRYAEAHEPEVRQAAKRLSDEGPGLIDTFHNENRIEVKSSRAAEALRSPAFGLVLSLRKRLEPFHKAMAEESQDALRATRVRSFTFEALVLVLVAEDPEFEPVRWGLPRLDGWEEAYRALEPTDAVPMLADMRGMIGHIATDVYFHGADTKRRPQLIWMMAELVREALAISQMPKTAVGLSRPSPDLPESTGVLPAMPDDLEGRRNVEPTTASPGEPPVTPRQPLAVGLDQEGERAQLEKRGLVDVQVRRVLDALMSIRSVKGDVLTNRDTMAAGIPRATLVKYLVHVLKKGRLSKTGQPGRYSKVKVEEFLLCEWAPNIPKPS